MFRAAVSVLFAVVWVAIAPAPAAADGLPVPVDGSDTASVADPSGEGPRYTAVSMGDRTRVLQIDQSGGEITSTMNLDGEYGVPLVALDGTASGLSADGGTLVLINPRTAFPRQETSFTVIGILNGDMRRVDTFELTLRGDYSFDALSPDGEILYLIEYLSRRDPSDYVVREYDLQTRRLIKKPVLVPDEPPGEMRGLPMTRVTSADGRWEYTLYDGGGDGEPFIHGLDTVESVSVCIDLPQLDGERLRDIYRVDLDLEPGGDSIAATGRSGELLASVDTQTFEVSDPPAPEAATAPSDDGPGTTGIGAIAVGLVLVAGTAIGLRRRRNRVLPADPFEAVEADSASEPERELDRV